MELKGYLGVYASTNSLGLKGDFATSQQVYLWFVWGQANDTYLLQSFDESASEGRTTLSIDEYTFLHSLVFKPHITVMPPETPHYEDVHAHGTSERAPSGRAHARSPYTEKELYEAIELDHELRVDFAVALTKYKNSGESIVFHAFEKVLAKNTVIVPHKHMFAGFGAALRKLGLYAIALRMHKQALDLAPNDAHAQCNLGRVYFELKEFGKAADCAYEALQQEPTLLYAQKLLEASTKRETYMSAY